MKLVKLPEFNKCHLIVYEYLLSMFECQTESYAAIIEEFGQSAYFRNESRKLMTSDLNNENSFCRYVTYYTFVTTFNQLVRFYDNVL